MAEFSWPEKTSGHPLPWQMGLQVPVTPVMEMLNDMHDDLLIITTAIAVFVMCLLGYVCFRFSAKRNPVPSKTSHNTLIEIIWTTIPVLILVVITIPALRTLYYMDKAEHADMTLKVVGYQWYWHYEYPDHQIGFDSYIKPDEEIDASKGEMRLLEVDNRIVIPVDTTVRVLVTAADVNHNFAMPAMGLKKDAIPGKLNETWFRATKEGTYRGQCSELCGVKHGFMPIVIDVVSKEKFDAWVAEAKTKFAISSASEPTTIASAE
jgi:cytochrome c oxidase subunit 2